MSFLGDLMGGGQEQKAPTSPAPYIPTPSPNATILTEGMDKTKHPNPGAIQSLGIRG